MLEDFLFGLFIHLNLNFFLVLHIGRYFTLNNERLHRLKKKITIIYLTKSIILCSNSNNNNNNALRSQINNKKTAVEINTLIIYLPFDNIECLLIYVKIACRIWRHMNVPAAEKKTRKR